MLHFYPLWNPSENQKVEHYLNTLWIHEFHKKHPRRRVFRNVNLSNLGNILQRNLRTDRTGECIFRASIAANFEHFSTQRLCEFHVCTSLPKKLWIRHWIMSWSSWNSHQLSPELVSRRCSVKKMFLKISQKLAEKHLCQSNNISHSLQLYWKRDSSTDVSLSILRNFQENHFYRTRPVSAFVLQESAIIP